MPTAARCACTKHHGAGNDFLVLLDPDDRRPLGAEVRALCDRRRGVGADGVIRVADGGRAAPDLAMELHNADGGVAEMSGNGIRCLVQAAVDAGMVEPPALTVDRRRAADGGVPPGRRARVRSRRRGHGPGRARAGPPRRDRRRWARHVDMGNPHLVLLGPDRPRWTWPTSGRRSRRVVPGGVNVEFISPGPDPDELTLRVWERGVGETLACGTGSLAAAAAAHELGRWQPGRVHNPGGALEVELGADGIRLAGPIHRWPTSP